MGYSIRIGNAEVVTDTSDNQLYAGWEVKDRINSDAPSFEGDEVTGNTNHRMPSYSQWAKFCKDVGLYDTFFNESSGLMVEHPGCKILTKYHLEVFEKALEKRNKENSLPAGLSNQYKENEFAKVDESNLTHDYHKVRLIWLIWWTKWALQNCEYPAIYNT